MVSERATTTARRVDAAVVGGGHNGLVAAGFLADRHVTLPKGQADKLAITLVALDRVIAPVQSGQRVGLGKVALDQKPIAEFPLIALEDVPPASLFGRAWDTVRLWFAK